MLSDGLPAVEAACLEALREGVHSADVIINILARHREPQPPITISTPEALRLRHAPAADCTRYDSLQENPLMERSNITRHHGRAEALWDAAMKPCAAHHAEKCVQSAL